MYLFNKYKGQELSKMPIDVGKALFNLNWSMSSFQLGQYIYQNNTGDLFYVNGILQHTNCMAQEYKDDQDDYHLVLVVPVVSKESLIAYLSGNSIMKSVFDTNSDCYVMKLGAPQYDYEWSGKIETSYSMHPVVERKEVTRKVEAELKEFELKSVKVCKLKDIPLIANPSKDSIIGNSKYELDGELSFIFISDEEKEKIRNFCK